ncbi:cupin domain-containing protein [Mesorhizobium sp. VNQ89]|uniref:cupin domain-containing protein n=1 Tax=Mesorhizobium quangtriensis TaxID=3157709 RepID=UPI0032B78721
MPRIDIDAVPARVGTGYPKIFAAIAEGRSRKRLGDAAGLDQFGVNLTTLAPGAGTAHRHWHHSEDEFVFVLAGEATLIDDDGETILVAGDAAGFKAGVANAHQIVNKSSRDVVLLEIGTRAAQDRGVFPDIDLAFVKDDTGSRFTRASGEAFD